MAIQMLIMQACIPKVYWLVPIAMSYTELLIVNFWVSYLIALMLANSKLIFGIIKLANFLNPPWLSNPIKIFLLGLSLATRNTIFMAASLFLVKPDNMSDFRVKLSWILLHTDMLVVDAWRVTDMIIHNTYYNLAFNDPFYEFYSKLEVIVVYIIFELLTQKR
jgi:hypothetical protein